MKMTKSLLFGATVLATLATSQNVRAANLASAAALASASVHGLIVASPHALEAFPWLLRETPGRTETTARSERALSAITENRALAASPRILEQFPQLARARQPHTIAFSERGTENRAWAASPRVKEEFPWLTRGYTAPPAQPRYEVAPVK